MTYKQIIRGMNKFGAAAEDVCHSTLGVSPEDISENVVLSPGWPPERIFPEESIELIQSASPLYKFKIYKIKLGDSEFTYFKAGYSAAIVLDAVLLLGLTKCKQLLFLSSVGALDENMEIGDILVPEYSASGDGACRYLEDDFISAQFIKNRYPDPIFQQKLVSVVSDICESEAVPWHFAKVFCTDSIVAEYNHLDTISGMGYNSLDLESAAAFSAAKIAGIRAAALMNISDNASKEKSLMSDRSEDTNRRKHITRSAMASIIKKLYE